MSVVPPPVDQGVVRVLVRHKVRSPVTQVLACSFTVLVCTLGVQDSVLYVEHIAGTKVT